jgi:anaerobic ribonucleoside-triphosphate reductase activating protein
MLNLADVAFDVRTLGPGRRVAVWTQGCPFDCPGCISPDWIPLRANKLVEPDRLAAVILEAEGHDGVTFSGGDPMVQARGLVELWDALAAARPDWTLIVFSGYRRSEIFATGTDSQRALLERTDAFIDGRYVASHNDGVGLRGSSNQEIWFNAGSRFSEIDRASMLGGTRNVEVRVEEDRIFKVGIPGESWPRAVNPKRGCNGQDART